MEMIDREKVIKGMETCIRDDYGTAEPFPCEECYCFANPTGDVEYDCLRRLITDAIALLKEQEPVEPREQEETRTWTVCGNCSQHLISKWLWCPYCGRKVKWNG